MKIPEQYNQLMPYLIVSNAPEFLEFTKNVFGATEQLIVPRPDGSVMHGELRIGAAVIMFADANETAHSTPSGLCLIVEDAEAAFHKGISQGLFPYKSPKKKNMAKAQAFRTNSGISGG